MKLWKIIALFNLSMIVEGWVQILQPILLSIGSAFTVLNSDILNIDMQPIEWRNWLSLSKKDEKKDEIKMPTKEEIELMKE